MKISLTDKETRKAIRDYGVAKSMGYGEGYFKAHKGEFGATNKAQLKKAAEWFQLYHSHSIEGHQPPTEHFIISRPVWLALLKEIE